MLFNKEEKQLKEKMARLESALHAALAELQTAAALKAVGGGSAPLLAPAVRDQTKLCFDGYAFKLVHEDGLSTSQIVEQLRQDPVYAVAFDRPGASAARPESRAISSEDKSNGELPAVERLKAHRRNQGKQVVS